MVYRPIRYEQMMKAAESFDVRARRMAHGMGIYTGECMFAFLLDDEIGLKLHPEDIINALALPGAELFRTSASAEPMKEYVKIPKQILDNYEVFVEWVHKSANYVQSRSVSLAQSPS